jgi:hypothetical protein
MSLNRAISNCKAEAQALPDAKNVAQRAALFFS